MNLFTLLTSFVCLLQTSSGIHVTTLRNSHSYLFRTFREEFFNWNFEWIASSFKVLLFSPYQFGNVVFILFFCAGLIITVSCMWSTSRAIYFIVYNKVIKLQHNSTYILFCIKQKFKGASSGGCCSCVLWRRVDP